LSARLDGDVKAALRDLPGLLSRQQVADLLGVCVHTVSRWIASGRLHGVKTCPMRQGRVRIPKAAVERMLTEGVA
jgi:excisionase family DNA binding protein